MGKTMAKVSGEVDMERIERLVRTDDVYVGYPDGVMHPAGTRVRHRISKKTGRRLKSTERVPRGGKSIENYKLAEILHFGSSTIRARPWLYDSLSSAREDLVKEMKDSFQNLIRKGKATPEKLGAFAVGRVQSFVRGGHYLETAPNAESTKRTKGDRASVPLIDTGFMINSTTFVTAGRLSKGLVRTPGGKLRVRPR